MKINTKITLGFLVIVFLCCIQFMLNFAVQNRVLHKTIEMENILVPLEVMAEKGTGYSTMLVEEVHGALIHAQNEQYEDVMEHKLNYDKIDNEEKELRHNVKILLIQSKISLEKKAEIEEKLKIIEEFNLKLIELENKGFAAIQDKNLAAANTFLIGGNHKIYKGKLFEAYEKWAKLQHQARIISSENIKKETEREIYINFFFSISIIILIITTLMILRSFIVDLQIKGKVR